MPPSTLTGHGISLNAAYTLSSFGETFIFGLYTMLFLSACPLMFKNASVNRSRSWSYLIFPIAAVFMYVVATIHLALTLHIYVNAYIVPKPQDGFASLWDFARWDSYLSTILAAVMTWTGDFLVIYRCYCIWNKNLPLITLPLLILAASAVVNIYCFIWFQHPLSFNPQAEKLALNAIWPLNLSQNVLTTGLITLKIWTQHRRSAASGVVDRSSHLSLVKVIRIIIESAMIYTLQLLILIILYFCKNNLQFPLQTCIIPSTGIVFVLISLRVHHNRQVVPQISTIGIIPAGSWLSDSPSEEHVSRLGIGSAQATGGALQTDDEGKVEIGGPGTDVFTEP